MRGFKSWLLFGGLVVSFLGCGGSSAEPAGAGEQSAGGEAESVGRRGSIARYEGTLAGALAMVIEFDDAGGGTVTYPASGRSQSLVDCRGEGPTLLCRIEGEGISGEFEMTRREDGGVDGRTRSDSDGTWAEFRAERSE